MPRPSRSLGERFADHVPNIATENGCLEWTGSFASKGYGCLQGLQSENRRLLLAHRVAWELAYGAIPSGLHVCHKCDNKKCVNAAHLFLGTNKDNHVDKKNKGRAAKGAKNGNSKLTSQEVKFIRKYLEDGLTHVEIAHIFAIHPTTVSQIRRGATWAHV